MRAKAFSALTIAGLVAGSASPLWSQSLADVAKKEEERRKQQGTARKVYTNKDLSPAPPAATAAPPADQATAKDTKDSKDARDAKENDAKEGDGKTADKAADDVKAADKEPSKDQTFWSKRMKGLCEALDRDMTLSDAVQSRINALTTDFVNRDDPAQRAVIERDRLRAVSELERLKKQIAADQKALNEAAEEARRAGVPPGWVR